RRWWRTACRGTAGDQTDRAVGSLHGAHKLDATEVIPGAVEIDTAISQLWRGFRGELLQLLHRSAVGGARGHLRERRSGDGKRQHDRDARDEEFVRHGVRSTGRLARSCARLRT